MSDAEILGAVDSRPVEVPSDAPIGVSVANLVSQVRAELEALDAERRRAAKPALLALDSVEIELQFSVLAATDSGEADLRVLPAEAAEGVQAAAVQKVRLRFTVDETARREGLVGSRGHATTFRNDVDDDFEPLDDLHD
jgi:hypothetical protein